MGYPNKSITDHLGRTFGTLRVSLTNKCNLACIYCVNPAMAIKEKPAVDLDLSQKELLLAIESIHKITPLHTIRFTGGEPTLYKGLISFISSIRNIGISNIKMTTNAVLLKPLLPDLIKAGLTEMNISLDAIHVNEFFNMTRRKNLGKTLQAIDLAVEHKIKIKINAVIVRAVNENQILPLFDFAKNKNISIRFLELMKMGHLYSDQFDQYFFSEKEILNKISTFYEHKELPRKQSSTANYWITNDGYKFGIIANESSPFCGDCDRLRIDHTGKIFGCLSENSGISVKAALGNESEMKTILEKALKQKQENKFTGSDISMLEIGG